MQKVVIYGGNVEGSGKLRGKSKYENKPFARVSGKKLLLDAFLNSEREFGERVELKSNFKKIHYFMF